MRKKIRLGVNIDHAATLRQVRGGTTSYPDLLALTSEIKKAGANQITIHLREDRRHIQDADVVQLCRQSKLPINLEMAVSNEMLKVALKNKPKWVCFVPEKREELTTEGGLDIKKTFSEIKTMTGQLKKAGIKVSFFIEANLEQVKLSAEAGADAIEFHTGHWVLEKGSAKRSSWNRLNKAANYAHQLNLGVHAGHGLDYIHNKEIKKLPYVQELNIGNSIVCYSLIEGVQSVTRKMIKLMNQ